MKNLTKIYLYEGIRVGISLTTFLAMGKVMHPLIKEANLPMKILYTLSVGAIGFGIGSGIDYGINMREQLAGLRDQDLMITEKVYAE